MELESLAHHGTVHKYDWYKRFVKPHLVCSNIYILGCCKGWFFISCSWEINRDCTKSLDLPLYWGSIENIQHYNEFISVVRLTDRPLRPHLTCSIYSNSGLCEGFPRPLGNQEF